MNLVALCALAFGVPLIPVQGELRDPSGAVAEGSRSVEFKLYGQDPLAAAVLIHDETVAVLVERGRFSAVLSVEEQDLAAFGAYTDLWLTVSLDGAESDPVAIGWAPRAGYAAESGHAAVAAHALTADSLTVGYSAGTGLTLNGRTFSSIAYSAGSGLVLNGGQFSAVPYTAGAGLTLSGTQFTAVSYSAGAGLTLSGGQFSAVPYTAGQGVVISGNQISVPFTAGSGLTLTGAQFAAVPYTAGAGLTLSGQQFAVTSGYVASEIAANAASVAASIAPQLERVKSGTGTGGCTADGLIRYNTTAKQLEYCDGLGTWRGVGQVDNTSCKTIKQTNPGSVSGTYVVHFGGTQFNAYCDMSTDGGGWTMVHTKTTFSFVPWTSSYNSACAAGATADCGSRTHNNQWTEVMWRFHNDANIWIKFARSGSAGFADWLDGNDSATNSNAANVPVAGWTRNANGTLSTGTVPQLHYYNGNYISNQHGGDDTWLDLWSSIDGTNGYASVTGTNTIGTKCIAGYCRDATVWFMMR